MNRPLFHVKVCGVTTPADAAMVAAAGADAVGLNFVAGSPRAVNVAAAREVRASLPPGVLAVGVFAGMPAAEMLEVARAVGLDAIQLHGHLDGEGPATDPPSRCLELIGLPVIRAVRLEADGLGAARRWIAAAMAAGRGPDMVIVDAGVAQTAAGGVLGGTGHRVDWGALAREEPLPVPAALAGGLTPENVAAAIQATGTCGVDTASGVEDSPGRKNADLVGRFVAAARAALGNGG